MRIVLPEGAQIRAPGFPSPSHLPDMCLPADPFEQAGISFAHYFRSTLGDLVLQMHDEQVVAQTLEAISRSN